MLMSRENPRGLISANLACRKRVLDRIGGFSPVFQRVKDGIGSLEDDEWNRRLWDAGLSGLYVPQLVASTDVPGDRLTRDYHRRWHRATAVSTRLLRAGEWNERARLAFSACRLTSTDRRAERRWLDRRHSADDSMRRSLHEVKLRFFRGFLGQRFTERRYS